MRQGLLHSVRPILFAPWQQRRNAGALWGVAAVIGVALLAPIGLFAWSVWTLVFGSSITAQSAEMAAELRHSAVNTGLWAIGALLLAGWALTVANLLDQNQPAMAQLVPEHPGRLRAALLVGWVASVAFMTLLVGLRLGSPLGFAAVFAPGLALLAASIRWPVLWLLGCVSPVVVTNLMEWPGLAAAVGTAQGLWLAQPVAIALTVAAAAVVLLMALIQRGGKHHVASDAARRTRVQRFQTRLRGGQPVAVGVRGYLDAVLTQAYYGWWRVVLSRPAPSVFGRVMLGLGPGAHWTASFSAVTCSAVALVIGTALLEAIGLLFPGVVRIVPELLAGLSIGMLLGLVSPALQVQARLHQSRREQGLLTLLPGVARGAVLNRRLAWQLSAQFLLAWCAALGVMALAAAAANVLRPGALRPELLNVRIIMIIATLPLLVFQWRPWARVAAPTALNALGPVLMGGLLAMLAWVGPTIHLFPASAVQIVSLGGAVAWCALRWHRMGAEPSALPVGRLA